MIKLKKGFTIIEILIALAIIGIISMLTVPLVVDNIQQKQSAATLSKAISQIETGNQNLIQFANSQSDDGSYSDSFATIIREDLGIDDNTKTDSVLSEDFHTLVRSFWASDEGTTAISPSIQNYDRTAFDEATLSNNYSFFKMSAGYSIVIPSPITLQKDYDADTGFVVYIDTNGWTVKPNRVGKDIFSFKLLNNGKLVPNTAVDSGDRAKQVIEAGFRIDY